MGLTAAMLLGTTEDHRLVCADSLLATCRADVDATAVGSIGRRFNH